MLNVQLGHCILKHCLPTTNWLSFLNQWNYLSMCNIIIFELNQKKPQDKDIKFVLFLIDV